MFRSILGIRRLADCRQEPIWRAVNAERDSGEGLFQCAGTVPSRLGFSPGKIELLQGEVSFSPAFNAAGEWPDLLDPVFSEEERHPGAAGLVGSGAVEDQIPIAGELAMALRHLVRRHAQGAGDRVRGGLHVGQMS